MSAACIIASYGDSAKWCELGERALWSAHAQTKPFDHIVRLHLPGGTLQEARNEAAADVGAEWLCFLDADDELDVYYHQAMSEVEGDIKRPSTLGVHEDGHEDDAPVMIPRCELRLGNFIVIGSFVRRAHFEAVGGFSNDKMLEDWDLFTRLHLHEGAEIVDVPDAIYRVHVRSDSRNQDVFLHGRVYTDIKNRHREAWQKVLKAAS